MYLILRGITISPTQKSLVSFCLALAYGDVGLGDLTNVRTFKVHELYSLLKRLTRFLRISFNCISSWFPIIRRKCIEASVTRFGEISPLWQHLKVFGQFLAWYILYYANFCIYFGNFYTTRQLLIAVNGQRLKNNLAIWSHWTSSPCGYALREVL